MFSPDRKQTTMENYLTYLQKKRAHEIFQRDMSGEKCSTQDALLCLQAVENYARRRAHSGLLESVTTSVKQLEQIMVTKKT